MPENTRDVVINCCFGGFSLSDAGMRRYLELAGIPYVETPDKYGGAFFGRTDKLGEDGEPAYLSTRDMPRDDPHLVQTVRELGHVANGSCAALAVVSIPADVSWHIDEYDGNEHVAEDHRTWY